MNKREYRFKNMDERIRRRENSRFYDKWNKRGFAERPSWKVRPHWMNAADPEALFCGMLDI